MKATLHQHTRILELIAALQKDAQGIEFEQEYIVWVKRGYDINEQTAVP